MIFFIVYSFFFFYCLAGWFFPVLLSRKAIIPTIGLMILVKLILISQNEILAVNGDTNGYVYYANSGYFNETELPGRPFFYPVWLFITSLTTFPYRYLVEIGHIASCGFFVFCLTCSGLPLIASLLMFGCMVFHPFTFGMLNSTYSETIYEQLLLLFSGLAILLFRDISRGFTFLYSALLGFCFFFLWHTRDEFPLSISIAICFLAYGFVKETQQRSCRNAFFLVLMKAFIPIVIFTVMQTALLTFNQWKWGYPETGSILNKEEKVLLDTLTRIAPPDNPQYMQVSLNSIKQAFQVCPAFNKIQDSFNDVFEHHFKVVQLPGGELNAAIFLWQMKYTLTKAKSTREDCRQMAQELDNALKNGLLPSRFSLGYDIPRDWNFFTYLPCGFLRIASILFRDQSSTFNPIDGMPANPSSIQHVFDRVANRRSALLRGEPVRGWLWVDHGEVEQINVYANGQVYSHDTSELITKSSSFYPNPTIPEQYKQYQSQANTGFELSAMEFAYDWNELALVFEMKDGNRFTVISPKIGVLQVFYCSAPPITIHYFLEPSHSFSFHKKAFLLKSQHQFGLYYTLALRIMTVFAFLLVLISGWRLWRNRRSFIHPLNQNLFLILLWVAILIGLRIAFYASIDAYFYPIPPEGDYGNNHLIGPRFLYPVCILYPAFLFILISLCLQSMKAAWSKEWSNTES